MPGRFFSRLDLESRVPHRLRSYSAFYFFYYACLGAFSPYIGRFVDSLGHGMVLGLMLAIWYGTRIVAPPAWNALLNRSSRPGMLLVAGCVATLLACAGFTVAQSAIGLCVVMALFGLAYSPLLPQFEAMTLNALGERSNEYGRIRVWGSIGFLLVASSYGWLLDRFGAQNFPWLVLPLFVAVVLSALPHRNEPQPHGEHPARDYAELWRQAGVRRFLIVALLMQMGFGAFYVYYTLHLQAQGHSGLVVGLLWGTGVLSEIGMFWAAPRLFARYGAPALMSFCLGVTVLRWAATAISGTVAADVRGAVAACLQLRDLPVLLHAADGGILPGARCRRRPEHALQRQLRRRRRARRAAVLAAVEGRWRRSRLPRCRGGGGRGLVGLRAATAPQSPSCRLSVPVS
jgi:PPP family 3-phenylpropionic acid transporter